MAVRATAEDLHGVVDVDEARLGGDMLGPASDRGPPPSTLRPQTRQVTWWWPLLRQRVSRHVTDRTDRPFQGRGNGTAEEASGDPHIWHDPKNAEVMSRNIAAAFSAKDAKDKAAFDAGLTAYTGKLDRLDTWIAQQIDTVPADRRKLVTNHDAFGYYVDRYHLTFVGSIIPSFDTSAELSGKQLTTLVAKIKATGVKAIFSESSLPPKTAETIGHEAGVTVAAGENSLYGDTLGPAGSAGATYLDMERHNTTTIVDALKG